MKKIYEIKQNSSLLFLKSAFSLNNSITNTQDVLKWVKNQSEKVKVNIERIPFKELKMWKFDVQEGNLIHESRKFFSIDGICVKTNWGYVSSWEQPIINQPEIGYLGFITKEFNSTLHFLVQAKIEPGNINYVQLSPTLQATKSNYTRAHNGDAPHYLEYFQYAKPKQILLDQLQSEQGGRFLKKRNRNIIIKIDEDIPVLNNYIWLTLAQIKSLMRIDNLVNMDTRTVISGISFGSFLTSDVKLFSFFGNQQGLDLFGKRVIRSMLAEEGALNSMDHLISFITRQKSFYELNIERIPLNQISNWSINSESISHVQQKYFKVIAAKIEIRNREVQSWTQPMIEPSQEGLCAFVAKEINGVLHLAVQAKLECGNFDIIELAPTVQCLTGNYRNSTSKDLPFLEYVLNAPKNQVIFDTLQSEEGGRFFKEQNRNMFVLAGDEITLELPDNYIWMTLNQLQTFIRFNNYINIQARSLLAALTFKTEMA